jgi:addiction module RelB/DinJ family antitoxin
MASVDNFDILQKYMSLVTRSAMLQMRVTPGVKRASEEVLRRIGLSMTEAMELFLRRMIVDQRIPFEVIALDSEAFSMLVADLKKKEETTIAMGQKRRVRKASRTSGRSKRE